MLSLARKNISTRSPPLTTDVISARVVPSARLRSCTVRVASRSNQAVGVSLKNDAEASPSMLGLWFNEFSEESLSDSESWIPVPSTVDWFEFEFEYGTKLYDLA